MQVPFRERNFFGVTDSEQFRTAPLWGLGQRLFFQLDGRTADLVQAIKSDYFATNSYCTQTSSAQRFYVLTTSSVYKPEAFTDVCNTEANAVINKLQLAK